MNYLIVKIKDQIASKSILGSSSRTRLALTLMLLAFSLSASVATNYHFSSSEGSDARSSIDAQNPNTPWKSLEKLNQIIPSLSPGDRILFKSGDFFYGSIFVNKSGTSAAPIVFAAYGQGPKPVISSLTEVDNWTDLGNGIFQATPGNSFNDRVNIVLINSIPQEIGRFPNFDEHNKGFKTILATSGKNQITSGDFSNSQNWVGAEIVLRKNPWIYERHVITYNVGNTINFETIQSDYEIQPGYGFFIQNHPNTLDKFGEWYFEKAENKLSVFFGNAGPNGSNVQISTKSNLIELGWKTSHVHFIGLDLQAANISGIRINEGTHIQILDSKISSMGEYAVFGTISDHLTVQNCSIENSLNNGLYVENVSQFVTLSNNSISNTFPFNGMGRNGDLNGQAIYTSNRSHSGKIEYNTITNTGFNAINFGGEKTVVRNNFIKDFCIHKTDGGGIYAWEGWDNWNLFGRVIEKNIILDGKGYNEGTDKIGTLSKPPVEGIYLDDNTSGITIKENTIARISKNGINAHNARDLWIENNLFYDCQEHIYLNHDTYGDPVTNITLNGNVFFSKYPQQSFVKTSSIKMDSESMGTFSNNFYTNPFGNDFGFVNDYFDQSWNLTSTLANLYWWGKDKLGKTSPVFLKEFESYETKGANLFKNGDFEGNLSYTFCNSNCSTTWKSSGDFNSGHIFVQSKKRGELSLEVGNLKANTTYILKFSAKADKEGYLELLLRQGESPWYTTSHSKAILVDTNTEDFEILLSNSMTTAKGIISIKSHIDVLGFAIDNLELLEADFQINSPEDALVFEYNSTNNSKTIPLEPGSYVDAKNNKHSGSVEITPFSSIVLIKTHTPAEKKPYIEITAPAQNASFFIGDNINITAKANDTEVTIEKVEFYFGDTLLGTDTTSPYSFTWENLPIGSFGLTVKAIDNNGTGTVSEIIKINVSAEENEPKIIIKTPIANTEYYRYKDINFRGEVKSPNLKILTNQYFKNNILLRTNSEKSYNLSWNSTFVGNPNIYSIATKNYSLTRISKPLNDRNKNKIPPAINIFLPVNFQEYYSGSNVEFMVMFEGSAENVKKVEYYSGEELIGSSTISPFDFTWQNPVSNQHSITAKVIGEDPTKFKLSESVNVRVKKNTHTVFQITNPVKDAVYTTGQNISINADLPEGDNPITRVDYFRGNSKIGSSSSPPFDFTWNNVQAGNYDLIAQLIYLDGSEKISNAVPIEVLERNRSIVKLVSPNTTKEIINGENLDLYVELIEFENEINLVEYILNGQKLGSSKVKPHGFLWDSIPKGNHQIVARALDSGGASYYSEPLNFSVLGDTRNIQLEYVIGPNPTTDYLDLTFKNLDGNYEFEFMVISMNSVLLKKFSVSPLEKTVSIDVSDLKNGIYILQIRANGNVISNRRFIKN